ncbi:Imprinted and ancient [Mycena indigotica]|uniref:Imprinted and ancient n=1 Tax=Mycena indigotica TaxID=2126181 RepID=A0A8H6S572_9AGAR|nr:Imprinted and ancient [Mycena indigotica]KAF7292978.1 Imprinted and ancient [Mycena indigotica]
MFVSGAVAMDMVADPSSSSWWRVSPMLSSTALDDDDEFFTDLTMSYCRRSSVPSPAITAVTPPHFAIFPLSNNTSTTSSEDVQSVNASPVFRPPSPAPRFNGFSTAQNPLSNNAPINTTTSNPTRVSVQYGLPRNLPPAPRPVATRSVKSTPTSTPSPDFEAIRNNYLTMLANKSTPDTPASTVAPSALISAEDAQAKAFKAIAELTGIPPSLSRRRSPFIDMWSPASPEFQSLGDHFPDDFGGGDEPLIPFTATFDESPLFGDASPFLTSPHDSILDDFGTSPMDTPFSEFLSTPLMGMEDSFMESPLIRSNDTLFGFEEAPVVEPPTNKLSTFSPSTPMLDSMDSPRPTVRRRNVTGTRKNLTPDSLISMDAPTQKRSYTAPSVTSRKALPAGFVRKRGFNAAFGVDETDDVLPELSPTATEQEQIEWKRRQNTLAARKSRKRKLEHQQGLEQQIDDLKSQVTMWRERALMAQEMLRAAGIKFNVEAMGT